MRKTARSINARNSPMSVVKIRCIILVLCNLRYEVGLKWTSLLTTGAWCGHTAIRQENRSVPQSSLFFYSFSSLHARKNIFSTFFFAFTSSFVISALKHLANLVCSFLLCFFLLVKTYFEITLLQKQLFYFFFFFCAFLRVYLSLFLSTALPLGCKILFMHSLKLRVSC